MVVVTCSASLLEPCDRLPGEQSSRDGRWGLDPCLALLWPSPPSCPPSGTWESKNRVLGNRSPCPEAPPCLQSHCMGLLSHLSQSFLKTPGYSCSEDGHLLAHPGVPHRTCIQTGVPAQGGSQSKRDTTYTHRTQTQEEGILRDTGGQGSYGLGHTACSSIVLLGVFVGEGEESRT